MNLNQDTSPDKIKYLNTEPAFERMLRQRREQPPFDYSKVHAPYREFVREEANNIKSLLDERRSPQNMIDIGLRLLKIRELIIRSDYFEDFARKELYLSVSFLEKSMQVAFVFKDIPVDNLDISSVVFYAISSPQIPLEIREEVLKLARTGVKITPDVFQEIKSKHNL